MSHVTAARALLLIAAGHTTVLSLTLSAPLLAMLRAGWWDSVGHDPVRATAFWSLYFGFALAVAALALARHRLGPWALLGLGLSGGLAMPVSGFWLALPAAGLWRRELR